MILSVIHSKSNLRGKIIAYTIFTSLILVLFIILSTTVSMEYYKFLELLVILILISQIVLTLYIYFSKKYNIIGKIIFQKEELIFKRSKNETRFKMEKIKEPKVLLSCNYFSDNDSIQNDKLCETGNFLIFQFDHKTIIYELLLKNYQTVNEFVKILNSYFSDNQIEILRNKRFQ